MVGSITLSVEIELGWGVHDLTAPDRYSSLSRTRDPETETLEKFLDLCEKLTIPVSFDVVGHLFLDGCTGNHHGPHTSGWFSNDPGTDVDRDPLFYAPDLVDRIAAVTVEHELCTHTFSHVLCDSVPRDVLEWELELAATVHADRGFPRPESLVPPRHRPVRNSVVREHGIRTVRVPIHDPPTNAADRLAGMGRSLSRLIGRSHPVCLPRTVNGVVETYSTLEPSLTAPFLPAGQDPAHPALRAIGLDRRQRLQRRYLREGLEATVEADSFAHFWTHLFNMSNEEQWPPVESFLRAIARRRDQGSVEILTMDALPDRVRSTA